MGPLAFIEWEDSLGCPQGWQSFEDALTSCVIIQSVGWVLRESKESVTLVPHVGSVDGNANQGQGIMTIPKRCILKREAISLVSSASGRASSGQVRKPRQS